MKTDFLSRIINWGSEDDSIRAMILIGSRAQREPCDELSDYDISIFTTNIASFTQDKSWIYAIGNIWAMIPQKLYRNDQEFPTRLVIFEGGVKVDFAFFSMELLQDLMKAKELSLDYNVGYQVLLDKDSITKNMTTAALSNFVIEKPSEEKFCALIEEFWFEAYHVAKYLKRGDLWSVKFRDHGIKDNLLLKIIEWNAQAKKQWQFSPHPNGKQMQSWVEKDIWESLHDSFVGFDIYSSKVAFENTVKVFRSLAIETAKMLGYHYPEHIDKNISGFIAELLDHL